MVIMILTIMFPKFLSLMPLGKSGPLIWSFFKLTKIALLHAYYSFNIYFFKVLFIHFFGANLVPKSEVLQINCNLVQR